MTPHSLPQPIPCRQPDPTYPRHPVPIISDYPTQDLSSPTDHYMSRSVPRLNTSDMSSRFPTTLLFPTYHHPPGLTFPIRLDLSDLVYSLLIDTTYPSHPRQCNSHHFRLPTTGHHKPARLSDSASGSTHPIPTCHFQPVYFHPARPDKSRHVCSALVSSTTPLDLVHSRPTASRLTTAAGAETGHTFPDSGSIHGRMVRLPASSVAHHGSDGDSHERVRPFGQEIPLWTPGQK